EFTYPPDWLVLQVPARPLLEGDTVTLRCCSWQDKSLTRVRFYRGDESMRFLSGIELSMSPLQLHQSSHYSCGAWMDSWLSQDWKESAPVTVTVHGELPTCHTSA
ncbi:FCGR2 protein, partial [Sylvia borin]|nr:FCGR2 protein [Sylvia borin]